jgi:uncharacterized membrane-anchored protein YitT (DUF2179 family)
MQMKQFMSEFKSYAVITLGILMYTFAVATFFVTNGIVSGGVSGLGTLVYYLSGDKIPVGVTYFVINAILIAISLRVLGSKFGIKTIYAMIIGSVSLWLFQELIPEPILDDKFLSAILGGILCGVGIGMALTQGGSTGGTDIVAMMINKYRNIGPGKLIMYMDVFIIATGFFVRGEIQDIVYGYVVMGVVGYTIDMFISGKKQSVQLFIFSKQYEEIADEIQGSVGRGLSVIDSTGWYTKEANKMIMVVVRKHEAHSVFKIVKHIDSKAFISMGTVMGVYGEGFDEMRA